MSQRSDWLPGTRKGILAMAKEWIIVMMENGQAWGLAAGVLTKFTALTEAAETALAVVENDSTNTSVAMAKCDEAFEALTADMRDTKRRYFLIPPLTIAGFVSLGLKPPDPTHTPGGTPTAQVKVETFLIGRHELGVRIVFVSGDENDPANKGFRICFLVVVPGEAPPADPEELRKSFFTKKKKDRIVFDYADSGKTVYFAVQIESGSGKQGPWGPLTSAFIP